MKYTIENHASNMSDEAKTQRMEQVQEALKTTRLSLARILVSGPGENLEWTGTHIDLIQLLHMIYLEGLVCDGEGRPVSFANLVKRAGETFHTLMPHNPHSYVARAHRCKGIKQKPIGERLRWLMVEKQMTHPVFAWIRKKS